MPDSGPTVASRTAMVVGGIVIQAARRLRDEVEARTRTALRRERTATTRGDHGATRIDQAFEPYPGVDFDDATYTRRRLSGVRLGRGRRRGRRRPRHRRGDGPRVVAVDDVGSGRSTPCCARARSRAARSRPWATPRSRRSSSRDGRYLNDRLETYLIPTALDAPRIETILVEAPFTARHTARRASASCRWTSARRPWSPRSTTRRAPGSTTCRRRPERILAALGRDRAGPSRRAISTVTPPRTDPAVPGDLPADGQRRRDRELEYPGCAACSTSSARTSA